MKVLVAGLFLLAGSSVTLSALPDPRDSIILESKIVSPGFYPGPATDPAAYVYLRMWITNKDSLAAIILPLEERTLSNGAYLIVGYPRNFFGTLTRLTNTLPGSLQAVFRRYDSQSPDTLLFEAFFDPTNPGPTSEPPNAVRKPFWEIKFDSALVDPGTTGQVEFDSTKYVAAGAVSIQFVNLVGLKVDVNFVKSVVTVAPSTKGDLNADFAFTPVDVVLMGRYVFLGEPPPAGPEACDLDCDGLATPADKVILLNIVFRGQPFFC